jgi:hypothetical protein
MRHGECQILFKKKSGRIRVDPRPARRVLTKARTRLGRENLSTPTSDCGSRMEPARFLLLMRKALSHPNETDRQFLPAMARKMARKTV